MDSDKMDGGSDQRRMIIYAGNCPVCEDGLVRPRTCGVRSGSLYGLLVCDECELTWRSPDLTEPSEPLDPETGACPISGENVWDQTNRWSTQEDICLFGWYHRMFFHQANLG